MATINSLPPELQSQILSYLPFQSQILASQASKRWKALLANNQQTRYEQVNHKDIAVRIHKFLIDNRSALVCKIRRGKVKKFLFKYDPTEGTYRKTRSQHYEIDITDSTLLNDPLFLHYPDTAKPEMETYTLDEAMSLPKEEQDLAFRTGRVITEKDTTVEERKPRQEVWPGLPTFSLDITLFCQGAYHPNIVQCSVDPKWTGEPSMSIRTFAERAALLTEEKIKESSKELHTTVMSRNSYNIDFRYLCYPQSHISVTAELYSSYVYAVADKRGWADSESVGFFLGVDPEDTLRYYY
ncbi:hypothetical protein TWF696_006802 [Orbilia brochopaga]|uniref:F-box domain-containing protein n=1 Tax=Orbilia brochopaga TaxID=3140254 RepID=A0AAV9UQP6_9PEZI